MEGKRRPDREKQVTVFNFLTLLSLMEQVNTSSWAPADFFGEGDDTSVL